MLDWRTCRMFVGSDGLKFGKLHQRSKRCQLVANGKLDRNRIRKRFAREHFEQLRIDGKPLERCSKRRGSGSGRRP